MRSGTLSSYQTTNRQNPSSLCNGVHFRSLLYVAVLMDGFPVFIHNSVRCKAHRFVAYSAEQRLFARMPHLHGYPQVHS